MKETLYSISDFLLKNLLFLWRFLSWVVVIAFVFFIWFNQFSPKANLFMYIAVAMVLLYKAETRIRDFMENTHKDLQIIKRKLGLKSRAVTDDEIRTESWEYIYRRVCGGLSFLKMREYYIDTFGFRRWATSGRELTEYFFKEYKMDKKGNLKLWRETESALLKELAENSKYE